MSGWADAGDCLRLALEAPPEVLIGRAADQLVIEHLDRDLPPQGQVGGEVNPRETTPPGQSVEPIASIECRALAADRPGLLVATSTARSPPQAKTLPP